MRNGADDGLRELLVLLSKCIGERSISVFNESLDIHRDDHPSAIIKLNQISCAKARYRHWKLINYIPQVNLVKCIERHPQWI
jgi:hypothetical protein